MWNSTVFTRLRNTLLALLLVVSIQPVAFGHGVNSERVDELDKRIAAEPANARLYLQRGRVQRDAEHWPEALADYRKALAINPSLHEAWYWRGDALLATGKPSAAIDALNKYLRAVPESPAGHRRLAEALNMLGRYDEATAHHDLGIQYDSNPPPQAFVERARHLARSRPLPIDRIEEGLLEAIRQHGKLVNYQELLVDLNLRAGRPEAAMEWLDSLPEALAAAPAWQLRRGRAAEMLGQPDVAGAHYRAVIAALDRLPAYRRRTPARLQLRATAVDALAELVDDSASKASR